MKVFIRMLFTIIIFILLFTLSPFHINNEKNNFLNNVEFSKARVIEVLKTDPLDIQRIKVLVDEGTYKGQIFTIDNTLTTTDKLLLLKKNDEVLLFINEMEGEEIQIQTYQYVREKNLLYLVLTFIALVIIIGGIKGVHAIFSVVFTVCVIYRLLLPGLLSGYNPVKLTIICSLIIAFFSLIIQQGISKKTFASFIGTLGGVTIAGIVTIIMSGSLRISLSSDDVVSLLNIPQNIKFNFQHLLFSGIVIGSLGANIDMSMSVATAMNEIKESKPHITINELISCGMNVGKDVIATMTNTLVLAYVGSSLINFMIFIANNADFNLIINLEDIVIEILRSFAGSMGILLSVPLTVFTRAFMEKR